MQFGGLVSDPAIPVIPVNPYAQPRTLAYRRATAWNASFGSQCQSEAGSSGRSLIAFVMAYDAMSRSNLGRPGGAGRPR